jgi:EAL domain-containing protein (putative c-di-GMP-specific phosphodiesterase class I)
MEALVRWARPGHGMVPPVEFMAVAERSGLILDIGQWVLRTACAQASRWQLDGRSVRLAVNLSPLQFKDPELVAIVRDALAKGGLAPGLLELELTEEAVMADTDATMLTLNAFRADGVRIALDDFGTGYSSLSYLKRMPLNALKVDRSFVTGLPGNADDRAIVRAILVMADSLGLAVTAEGVENFEQAQALKAMDCGSLQGFYFSRPVDAQGVPALLARHWVMDAMEAGAA